MLLDDWIVKDAGQGDIDRPADDAEGQVFTEFYL